MGTARIYAPIPKGPSSAGAPGGNDGQDGQGLRAIWSAKWFEMFERHCSRSRSTKRAAILNAALAMTMICCSQFCSIGGCAAGLKFRADEWVTECDAASRAAPDCSITVPFWQGRGNPSGSFALVIMLQTGNIGIVGEPFPRHAVLRVDKNPPIECRQARYCVFPSMQASAVLKQLRMGSLILIDVYTDKGEFSFSLTPKGFQAGIAQIRAWGYRSD